jgi:hypothetical protein
MANDFSRLVASIPLSEREAMLERLTERDDISHEPLYSKKPEDAPKNAAADYPKLSWWKRALYFLLAFFTGKKPLAIYEDALIAKLGHEINQNAPGFYDYSKTFFLTQMKTSLIELKEASRFFYTALDSSLSRGRGAFYAFMSSFEMPDVHKALTLVSNAETFSATHSIMDYEELQRVAVETHDNAVNSINDAQKQKMYANVRSLICLKELSSFLFDRVINSFQHEDALNNDVCPSGLIRDQLGLLNNILLSLKEIPPPSLLSTLFIFMLQTENEGDNDVARGPELSALMKKTETSLAAIRHFNQTVPLTLILRCAGKNMSYEPKELTGGEDWFVVYKSYWTKLISENYYDYIARKKNEDLVVELETFLHGGALIKLENTASNENPDGVELNSTLELSFLLTFYKLIFLQELNPVLRSILIDGDFYRIDNKLEFTDCYNTLIKLEDTINTFIRKIQSDGDIGKQYARLKQEVGGSAAIRIRKVAVLLEDSNNEAVAIVTQAGAALNSLNQVVQGIVSGKKTSPYSTLINLSQMGGKANAEFMEDLLAAAEKINAACKTLADIEEVSQL